MTPKSNFQLSLYVSFKKNVRPDISYAYRF